MSDEKLPSLPGHYTRRVDGGAVEFVREVPIHEALAALTQEVQALAQEVQAIREVIAAIQCTCAVRQ